MDGPAIGIDLGTYNSCAAFAADASHVHMIRSQSGRTAQGMVFPSFLRFDALGEVQAYGEEARQQMPQAPESVVWGVKRLIGRSYGQVQGELRRFAYPIEEGPGGRIQIPIGPRRYSPADISALVLQWIKRSAEAGFNPFVVGDVRSAVITHPAYFDALQIEQTKQAAMQAGFGEGRVELIAEPVAAALAYGVELDARQPQFIMTIDWGAGTLDIVIVALMLNGEGRPVVAEAQPARGDVALGGIDMDDMLLASAVELYDLKEFRPLIAAGIGRAAARGADIPESLMRTLPPSILGMLFPAGGGARPDVDASLWGEFYKLRDCIERAKIDLSGVPAVRSYTTYQGRGVEIKMARSARDRLDGSPDWIILESTLKPALDLFRRQVEFAIGRSGLGVDAIRHVLLVGGPVHMPCVRRVVQEVFARNRGVLEELKVIDQRGFPVDPMEAVARGAALNARGTGPVLGEKVIPRDYGIIFGGQGQILIRDGDGVPCQAALNGPLSARAKPGEPVPFGLFMREVGPDGEHYSRMGDYQYHACVGRNGKFKVVPALQVAADKIVSLVITDLVDTNKRPMHLERLSELAGRPIPKPLPFGQGGDDDESDVAGGGGGKPPAPDNRVDAETVAQQVRSAKARLNQARNALRQHPLVRTNAEVRKNLEERIAAVEEAQKLLPDRGPAGQREFTEFANRLTELIHALQVYGIASADESQR